MPIVAIAQHEPIEPAITDALHRLELEDLLAGKVVVVKPNDTWASPQDTTGVTQADTLQAVIQHIKSLGPRRLIVTGGSGAAQTEEVFRYSGMMDVVRTEEVEFHDHNRPPFVELPLDYGPQASVVVNEMIAKGLSEGWTFVSLASLKLHETATVTLSMKNIAMSFPAADYYGHPRASEQHQNEFFDDMHAFIVGMIRRFPIQLAIVVGHPAMIATGPLGGKPVETGLVIASRDAVAADTVGARLLGFKAQAVRHIWEAGRQRLGETNLRRIETAGLSVDRAIRIFTKKAYGVELTFQHS